MLWHAVITRFSYRHSTTRAGLNGVLVSVLRRDPLQPERLAFRYCLFELTCLPSLLAQTEQNFDWFIIVDPDLPQPWRERLQTLVAARARTHLHDYDPGEDLSGTQWLSRHAPPQASLLVTTLLDDDDALPSNFIEQMQRVITERSSELAPVATLASRNSRQWELLHSRRAPLGYQCTWHRGNWVLSTGLSLLCRWPQHNVTVLAIHHQVADLWYRSERGPALMQLLQERWSLPDDRAVEATAFIAGRMDDFSGRVAGYDETTVAPNDRLLRFVDMSDVVEPFVVSNHFGNDQVLRLFEPKSDRVPVQGAADFPGVPIDLGGFQRKARSFAKRPRIYRSLLAELWSRPIPLWPRLRLLAWASWRFARA
ncbi:hypothetical protein FHT09_003387 [Xanthomonas arboricola]|uniref:glycosyltransferase n=1 Tax=Xanthomonas TaxID=338 RepID=UPI000CEE3207|nr:MULTISPECIES: glycosyltransferase [Xanthomonas]MBB5737602.1 hypothetical protein [Xanthomonas sp. CFBP 8152]PPT79477.1 hypothetical protein XarbCFBP8152_09625 [Xanthomonas arboricola]